jgi:hypothetical protein
MDDIFVINRRNDVITSWNAVEMTVTTSLMTPKSPPRLKMSSQPSHHQWSHPTFFGVWILKL